MDRSTIKSKEISKLGESTKAVCAGELYPNPLTGSLSPEIVMSTSFSVNADSGFSVETKEEDNAWVYSRWGNPTVRQLEEKLAALENAEDAIALSSGMGAITTLLFHLLRSGDHAIISDVSYAALSELTNDFFPNLGISITKVDTTDIRAVKNSLRYNTKLIYIETPNNPILRISDIKELANIARSVNARLAVDSTFATPIATKPLDLGADFVIHSLTKYICGHGDALGGAIIGRKKDIGLLKKDTAIRLGSTISPFNAWLIMRGLSTLPLRMERHQANALKVANYLNTQKSVKKVIYPGLKSHPQHRLAQKQMKNYSGMISFQVEDGKKLAKKLVEKLKIIHYAVSLGHHRSLIFYLDSDEFMVTSFMFETGKQLDSWNEFAGRGIFRLSVGLEDPEDIIRDLDNVLS